MALARRGEVRGFPDAGHGRDVAFYRKLGLAIPDTDPRWQRHHRTAAVAGGIDLDLRSSEFAGHWDRGSRGGMGVLGFRVGSRERVDRTGTRSGS